MSEYERTAMETANEYERRLITLAKQGDQKALDWLFGQALYGRGLQDYVFGFCHRKLFGRPKEEIEDVAAEAIVEIFKSLPKFDFRAHVTTWAGRILLNVVSRYWAQNERHQTVFVDPVGDGDYDEVPLPTSEAAPFSNLDVLNEIERRVEDQRVIELFDAFTATLPDKQRGYLRHYYLNEGADVGSKKELEALYGLAGSTAGDARKRIEMRLKQALGLDIAAR